MTCREDVGGTKEISKAIDHRLVFPSCAVARDNRFRAKGILVMEYFLGNDIQGLIPGDALPLPAPLWSDSANRVGESIRMIDKLCGSDSF